MRTSMPSSTSIAWSRATATARNDITGIDIADIRRLVGEEAVDWVAAAAESTRDEAVRLARAAEPEPFIPVPAAVVSAVAPELRTAEPSPAIEPVLQASAPAPEPVIEPAPSPAPSVPEETVAPDPDEPDAGPTPLAAADSANRR